MSSTGRTARPRMAGRGCGVYITIGPNCYGLAGAAAEYGSYFTFFQVVTVSRGIEVRSQRSEVRSQRRKCRISNFECEGPPG